MGSAVLVELDSDLAILAYGYGATSITNSAVGFPKDEFDCDNYSDRRVGVSLSYETICIEFKTQMGIFQRSSRRNVGAKGNNRSIFQILVV